MAITADYYVDLVSGNDSNAGTSTGAAFKTIQKGVDTATAAQVVAIKTGTETLTVPIDFDTNAGSGANTIQYVGVNSSWDEDGTMVTIDANSTATYCINRARNFLYFRNIWFKNGTTGNVENGDYGYFFNCRFSGSAGTGTTGRYDSYVNCTFDNNAGNACTINTDGAIDRCFILNGNWGVTGSGPAQISNSIIHNFSIGVLTSALMNKVSNNVIDACATGINSGGPSTVTNNRITNSTTKGINLSSLTFMSNNFFYNPSASSGDYGTIGDIGFLQQYNRVTADNSDDGYSDQTNDDFTLARNGDGVGVAVKIGELAESSTFNITQGIPPAYATAVIPTFAGITKFEILSNGSFYVEWAAGTGTITAYQIFIHTATNPFTQNPICFDSTLTSAIINTLGDGVTMLTNGTTYYCGVRADNGGTDDGNSVELSNICSGVQGIQRMTNTVVSV